MHSQIGATAGGLTVHGDRRREIASGESFVLVELEKEASSKEAAATPPGRVHVGKIERTSPGGAEWFCCFWRWETSTPNVLSRVSYNERGSGRGRQARAGLLP